MKCQCKPPTDNKPPSVTHTEVAKQVERHALLVAIRAMIADDSHTGAQVATVMLWARVCVREQQTHPRKLLHPLTWFDTIVVLFRLAWRPPCCRTISGVHRARAKTGSDNRSSRT